MGPDSIREQVPGEKDRHLFVAVDESENSKRAVLYVADFLGGFPGFRVTLFHVISLPQEEFFSNEEEREKWIKDHQAKATDFLERYRQVLIQSGFPEEKVAFKTYSSDKSPVAECILEEHKKLESCTIVLGRHGKSRQDEFLFGSVTNRIIHLAKKCSVWVVE